MRVTGRYVLAVNQYAADLSDGHVAQASINSAMNERGSRIIDGDSGHVWLGQPREAAAYYLGLVDVFAHRRGVLAADYPDEVQQVRAEVLPGTGKVPEWFARGSQDAAWCLKHDPGGAS